MIKDFMSVINNQNGFLGGLGGLLGGLLANQFLADKTVSLGGKEMSVTELLNAMGLGGGLGKISQMSSLSQILRGQNGENTNVSAGAGTTGVPAQMPESNIQGAGVNPQALNPLVGGDQNWVEKLRQFLQQQGGLGY